MLRRMRISRTLAALAPLAISTLALAEEGPTFTPSTNPIVGYLVGAVLFGIILAISLMPSKRSHQDL